MRLIDADALKASIEEKDRYNLGGTNRIVVCGMLDDAPTIEAEPVKHGRWSEQKIRSTSRGIDEIGYYCSECGYFEGYIAKYCAGCGAKMDLKDGESE
jgi:hypothetical protein